MTTGIIGGRDGYPDDDIGFSDVARIFEGGDRQDTYANGAPSTNMSARDYFDGLVVLANGQDAHWARVAEDEAVAAEKRRRDAAKKTSVDSAVETLFAGYPEIDPTRMRQQVDVFTTYSRLLAEPAGLKQAQRERATDMGHAAALLAAASTTGESGEPLWRGGNYTRKAELAAQYLLVATGYPNGHVGPYRAPQGVLSLSDGVLSKMPKGHPANITQQDLSDHGYYDSLPVVPRTAHPTAAILAADALHYPQILPLNSKEWSHVVKNVAFAARDQYGYVLPMSLSRSTIIPHNNAGLQELRILAEIIAAEAHDLRNASPELYGQLARRVHRVASHTQLTEGALPQRARGTFEQLLRYHNEHRFDEAREHFRKLGSNIREFVTDPLGWLGLPTITHPSDEPHSSLRDS